jgi:hypothetical protein
MKMKTKLKKLKKRNRALKQLLKKSTRDDAAFQKILALRAGVAAKIADAYQSQSGTLSSLEILVIEFRRLLRADQSHALMNQISVLTGMLDMEQKLVFIELLNAISSLMPEAESSTEAAASGPNGSSSS